MCRQEQAKGLLHNLCRMANGAKVSDIGLTACPTIRLATEFGLWLVESVCATIKEKPGVRS